MGNGHESHVRQPGAGSRHRKRLLAALVLLAAVTALEVATAWWADSLALLSDGAHMFTDVLGIGMSLAALQAAAAHAPAAGSHRTYGLYRLEVLAALANAVLLFGVAGYVLVEAVRRFSEPPDVLPGPMLVVAVVGLVANLIAFLLLRSGAKESLGVRGAYLEVAADTVGSVGVILAAVVILVTGWRYADPLVAVAVAGFILPRTWRLAGTAGRILVQAAPPHLDVTEIERALLAVPDVVDVHDLHVWTLTSGMEVASAHLTVAPDADPSSVLAAARTAVQEKYRIHHATLQLEPAGTSRTTCQSVGW